MSSSKGPNLNGYLDKEVSLHLNKGRYVQGTLRGYDMFMNVVLDEAQEMGKDGVPVQPIGMIMVRGNSILQFELLSK